MRIGQILYGFVIIISTAQRDVLLSRSREFSSDMNKKPSWLPPQNKITEHVIHFHANKKHLTLNKHLIT